MSRFLARWQSDADYRDDTAICAGLAVVALVLVALRLWGAGD